MGVYHIPKKPGKFGQLLLVSDLLAWIAFDPIVREKVLEMEERISLEISILII